jgi:hypothetical protein
MVAWNNEIVTRLASGSIPRVILYGDSVERPEPPFVMVKPVPANNRKILQIYVYDIMGRQDILEAYLFRELPVLLKEPLVSASGETLRVKVTDSWSGPHSIADNAISMSRDFWIPLVL